MIRVAAAGDIHYDQHSSGKLGQHWPSLEEKADLLLLAGDLTQLGVEVEIKALAKDLAECPIPVVTVLGNHDYHSDQEKLLTRHLTDAGVTVLERSSTTFEMNGTTIGVYGMKGFGGGFLGASCADFGEAETKNFIRHTKALAEQMREGLEAIDADYKIVLLHYSPVADTVFGEKKEIYPFLGSYLLAEAIDSAGAHVVFHGHAHKGTERGKTPRGIPVRNVAQPVIRHAFNIYCLRDLHENDHDQVAAH
jgi:Icc-related predicted phosphoesterase